MGETKSTYHQNEWKVLSLMPRQYIILRLYLFIAGRRHTCRIVGRKRMSEKCFEHAGIDKLIGKDHVCSHITIIVRMANKIAG